MAAAPSVVVSPEVSPEVSLARQEITETRPAFGRRALGWIVLGVGLAGLAAGGLIAAIVVWRLGAHAAVSAVAAAATDAGSDAPRAARDRDANAFDANAFDASVTDANANAADAGADDAGADDASGTSSALATSPRIDVAAPREADRGPRTTAAPREGRLEVVVVPWGRVEIDGTDVGRSPYRGTVATGSHRVEGVAGEERRTRTVRVTGRGVTRVQIAIE
jgi:hypothetical protein